MKYIFYFRYYENFLNFFVFIACMLNFYYCPLFHIKFAFLKIDIAIPIIVSRKWNEDKAFKKTIDYDDDDNVDCKIMIMIIMMIIYSINEMQCGKNHLTKFDDGSIWFLFKNYRHQVEIVSNPAGLKKNTKRFDTRVWVNRSKVIKHWSFRVYNILGWEFFWKKIFDLG